MSYRISLNDPVADVNPKDFAFGGAVTGAHLSSAATAATAAGVGVVVSGTVTITTALGTISTPLRFEGGGKLALNTGGSVTLTGTLFAPARQIFDTSGGGTLTFQAIAERILPQWWGAVADGSTDCTSALQAAITAAGALAQRPLVYLPAGTYKVVPGISIPAPMNIRGAGKDATKIIASSAGTGSPPTFTAGGTAYPATMDWWPVLYNSGSLWGWDIGDMTIDGGGFNVYGLRLQEDYYGEIHNLVIQNCGKRPYINVRAQAVVHRDFQCYSNSAGALLYAFTAVSFLGGGFERNAGTYALELRQPQTSFNKGMAALQNVWFEGESPNLITNGFLAVSGRAVTGHGLYFTLDTYTAQNCIALLDAGDTITVDAIAMAAQAATGALFQQINCSANMATYLGVGTSGCTLVGNMDGSKVTDASTNTTNTVRLIGSSIDWPYVMGHWQARKSLSGLSEGTTTTTFNVDIQDDLVQFFSSANNFIKNNSGILEIGANSDLRLKPLASHLVAIQDQAGNSDYSTGYLAIGSSRLFQDGNNGLRLKTSAPSSATDGRVLRSDTVATKTGAYTLTGNDGTILADATGGTFAVTLPSAATYANCQFTVAKIDSSTNVVTVGRSGGDTINGATSATLATQYAKQTYQSNGTSWYVVSGLIDGTAGYLVGTGANSGRVKSLRRSEVHPSDSGHLAWTFPALQVLGSTALATAGTLYSSLVWVEEAVTVSKLCCYVGTAGGTLTSGQNGIALFDSSGNCLAQANADAAWAGTGSTKVSITKDGSGGAISSVAIGPGVYEVGVWFNGTTGPQIGRLQSALSVVNTTGSQSLFFTSSTLLTTLAPNPRAARVSSGVTYWFALE